ncbi:YopX family protein [Ruminococcus bicirculans (ex Wegman et al. 2014)]
MREILFRGKRTDNGEWVQGFYVCKKRPYFKDKGVNLEHIICDNVEVEDNDYKQFVDTIMTTYMVNPETIGQYTGCTDKNGNKIFEGDIVWDNYEEERGVVQWDNDMAKFIIIYSTFTVDFDNVYGEELQIDGNVYDNAELIKEKQ